MTNEQLYLVIGLPIISNLIVVLVGILLNNGRLSDLKSHVDSKFAAIDQRLNDFKEVMSARFDTAHANLLRVEQVLDARLKHLVELEKQRP